MPQQDQDTVSSVPSELALARLRALAARVRAHALAGACVALLASCGGGGGGGDAAQAGAPAEPPPSTPAPPPSTPPAPPPSTPPAPPPPATPPATPSAVPLVAPGTWVVMGSSTAAGANADTLSWVQALAAGYATRSVSVTNLARGGSVTYSGLPVSSTPVANRPAPIPTVNVDAAMALKPKLLLLSYPTNDTDAGYTVDETVRNLLAIRSFAQTGGAAVIILSTQPRPFTATQLATLREIDNRLSAAVGPCFVPVREALGGTTLSPAYISSRDTTGVHPNDAGHAVIYRLVAEVIDSGKCVRTR